jgi:hypothetical protein
MWDKRRVVLLTQAGGIDKSLNNLIGENAAHLGALASNVGSWRQQMEIT